MAVTFIVGRAGSGKTARCFGRIRQLLAAEPLGAPIYLVVPNQATFQVEREMMAATGGFSRLNVVSFDLLGRQIAMECGDAAVPEVTSLGRQLILGHLLRRHRSELRFFDSVAHQPGMAAELDATFAELERSGKTDADLGRVLESLGRSDPDDRQGPSLHAKLWDLWFLYNAYQKYLGQERLDQHRRLTQAVSQLLECTPLRNAMVFVDDFYSFTEYERRFLAGLGRACPAVEINLTIDPSSPTVRNPELEPDEMSLFHKTERAYRQLWKAMEDAKVELNQTVKLDGAHRFQTPDLVTIEREAFSTGRASANSPSTEVPREGKCPPLTNEDLSPSNTGLRLVEAPDLRAEVDAVARGIVDLLREGHRLRDVAVLARDLGPYQQLIDTSFPEHGLSGSGGSSYFFVDRRRSAEHHPLLAFVRAMFQIAMGRPSTSPGPRWPMPAVMSFLKTGLAGLSLLEADEIENYLIQHRLGGAAWDDPAEWAYQREITAPSEEGPPLQTFEVRDIEAIRRGVVGGLQPFIDTLSGPAPFHVRVIAAEVFGVFERFNVRGALAKWAADAVEAGQPEQGAEHEQVWKELVDLFEQMVDLLGDEQIGMADFVDILEWGLERFTLALTPPTVDQVLVGQVGRTRTPEVKAVFVLGMNEGQFPRAGRDESILSHWERRELARLTIELDPGSDRQRLDELFLGYIALTRASRQLIASRPLSDESGRPTYESVFWRRLRDLLPSVQPTQVLREMQSPRDIRRIATPRQLLGSLMQWAREEVLSNAAHAVPVGPALRTDSPMSKTMARNADPTNAAEARTQNTPHPNALPEYREREKSASVAVERFEGSGSLPRYSGGGLGRGPTASSSESPPLPSSGIPWEGVDADPRASLYQWLVNSYPDDGAQTSASPPNAIGSLIARVWPALSYSNDARLSDSTARELFPTPLQASVAQLETFAACPFRHFVRYGVRLTVREELGVTGLDMSQLYHRVLQYMATSLLERGQEWSDLNADLAQRMIHLFAGNVARDVRGELMLSSARNKYLLSRIERTLARVVRSLGEMQSRGSFRPVEADIGFGRGGKLPAYHLRTPGGKDLKLSGRIDRVDALNAEKATIPAIAIYDYKLSAAALSFAEVEFGLSLQLLCYLMVLKSQGEPVVGKPLTPGAAFYYPLLRRIKPVDHPSEVPEASDPLSALSRKPRGVFDSRFFAALDNSAGPGQQSHVVQARVNKDGQLGNAASSDFVSTGELNALLEFVHQKLGEIGDQILSGKVDVKPYRMGKATPCPRCEYRSVCRFEPGPGAYRHLTPAARQEALSFITATVKGRAHGT